MKKIQLKKLILPALALSVFGFLYGWLTCGWLFTWMYELEPTLVWRPMDGAPGVDYHITALVLNAVFVYVYLLLQKSIPGKTWVKKGTAYGLIVWAIGMLPGMFMTHFFMTVATTVVIYWAVSGVISLALSGMIVSYLCKK